MTRTRDGDARQNLTVQLSRDTIRQARLLAAKRGTSISKLLAATLERLVAEHEAYDAARIRAEAFLEGGFHLGGKIRASREDLHDRQGLRRHQRPDLRA